MLYLMIISFLLIFLLCQVVQNDLTKENVDAVVNAANSWLKHGGGVSTYLIIFDLSNQEIGVCMSVKAGVSGVHTIYKQSEIIQVKRNKIHKT